MWWSTSVRLATQMSDAHVTHVSHSAVHMQANILSAIAWLVGNCQPSDSLFFSFSGHGCQPPHPEGGSWDEAILPCDFQQVCSAINDSKGDFGFHTVVQASHRKQRRYMLQYYQNF